jgi:hypothetical protein
MKSLGKNSTEAELTVLVFFAPAEYLNKKL